MNETRKKIIELIEPYMDKTEDEGLCLGLYNVGYKYSARANFKFKEEILNYYEAQIRNADTYRYNISFIKTIGHYDITAILKYIHENTKQYNVDGMQDNIILSGYYFDKYELPNKPLYLYSENEEKELLKMLQSLNNKQDKND